MNNASSILTLIGSIAVMALTAACGGGGAPAEDDSPEGQAYQYRHAVMELVARKNAILGGMARGEMDDNEDLFRKSASDLVVLAGMIPEGFEQEGIAPGSRAMPEIWANMSDFEQKEQDLVDAVTAVSNAAESGDFARAKELAMDVGPTCGACHRPYRAPAD